MRHGHEPGQKAQIWTGFKLWDPLAAMEPSNRGTEKVHHGCICKASRHYNLKSRRGYIRQITRLHPLTPDVIR